MNAIAVIDLTINELFIYDVPEENTNEQTEEFIMSKHHLNSCSWGVINGTINDLRND